MNIEKSAVFGELRAAQRVRGGKPPLTRFMLIDNPLVNNVKYL